MENSLFKWGFWVCNWNSSWRMLESRVTARAKWNLKPWSWRCWWNRRINISLSYSWHLNISTRNAILEAISEKVKKTRRTADEVRRRWQDISRRTEEEIAHNKTSANKTRGGFGGGEPPRSYWATGVAHLAMSGFVEFKDMTPLSQKLQSKVGPLQHKHTLLSFSSQINIECASLKSIISLFRKALSISQRIKFSLSGAAVRAFNFAPSRDVFLCAETKVGHMKMWV